MTDTDMPLPHYWSGYIQMLRISVPPKSILQHTISTTPLYSFFGGKVSFLAEKMDEESELQSYQLGHSNQTWRFNL